ncbi:MAG: VOC family protein [Alphaproteobacteria bacterium]|nr:glyoxalase [Hyphomonas sp.]MBR9807724.1 VOC family protein [Alphaproteobacteria bacterium]|tara:strand:- start:3659 stop:4060 length:402 start_codon:yes stop_codon:yes gene_type:complete
MTLLKSRKLRVARPTDNLEALLPFYCTGLGFEVLGSFRDHSGIDGIMLGHPGAPYHLEFTCTKGHEAGRSPSQDHLLVFYVPEAGLLQQAVERMKTAGFLPVVSFNPYWDQNGYTFEDPDGYRTVLEGRAWPV